MSDVRQQIATGLALTIVDLKSTIIKIADVVAVLNSEQNALQSDIDALNKDMLANPIPASPTPVVVTPPPAPSPSFVSIPFVSTEFIDVFNAVRGGGAVAYFANAIQFEPNAAASATPSTTVGTTTPGTASIELELARTVAKPFTDFQLRLTAQNVKQLRTSGPANTWECPWIFFNQHKGSDGIDAYNYIAFKTNGLEIGMGFSVVGQKYLFTTGIVAFPVGVAFTADLKKIGTQLTLLVNGKSILLNNNFSGMYNVPGAMSLYSEDARVLVSQLDLMVLA